MQLEKAKELEEIWKNERPYSGGKYFFFTNLI